MKETTRIKWSNIIEEFNKSGQASAKQWCRENKVCYPIFLQWRKELAGLCENPSFVELKSRPALEIRYGGIEIQLSEPSDLKILKDLLRALC